MFNGFDLSYASNIYFGNSSVELYFGNIKIYPKGSYDYSRQYLTIVSLEDNNTIGWNANNSSIAKTISISTDGGSTWTNKTSSTSPGTTLATLNTGDKLLVKGNNDCYATSMTQEYNRFSSTGNFNIEGNIMSLIYEDNFYNQSILPNTMTFKRLFYSCNKLINASNLILPSTSLKSGCYYAMFEGCRSLITAPELPANTLVQYCYYQMFSGCNSLNYIKCLATNISANNCTYNWVQTVATSGIFVKDASMSSWTIGNNGIPIEWIILNDSDLPIAWELSSYTMGINSKIKPKLFNPYNLEVTYNSSNNNIATINSFGEITYLNEGTVTLTASFAGNSTYQSKIASCLLNITDYNYYYDYLTIASLEDNNTIGWNASNASLLKTISISTDGGSTWTEKTSSTSGEILATLNSGDKLLIKGNDRYYATSSYYNKFTSTGNFNVEGNIMSLIYGSNFIGKTTLTNSYTFTKLFTGCTYLESAENLILPATTLGDYCYSTMFNGCTSLTTAPEILPATTLANYCYNNMFYGCTSLTTAPELPATTLANYCYYQMFYGCQSLNYIKCLATNIPGSGCTNNWVNSVASTGIFVKDNSMSSWTTGNNGIPSNWIIINNSDLPINWQSSTYSTGINAPNNIKPKLLNPYNLPVTYSSSNTSIATINSSGEIIYLDEGIVTLTASFSGNSKYQPKTVTCILNIYEYDYSYDYLTIESLEDNNTINWVARRDTSSASYTYKTISISTDNGNTWIEKTSTSAGTELATINSGNKLLVKGNGVAGSINNYNHFTSTGNINIEGNIMSLQYEDDFIGKINMRYNVNYAFRGTFAHCTKLISAENLILPVELTNNPSCYYCYQEMFIGCTSLIYTPKLPATTLAYYCYKYMFAACTSLTTAPELPATTLAMDCYQYMFYDCTSLTTAPELPATTLAAYCYQYMFYGCTALTTAPELPATTLSESCYQQMFVNCSSLTTAPELPATILAIGCYREMFYGCTALTTAPELPATTLANYCYYNMFQGCISLTTAPELPVTTLANSCYFGMFDGCIALTTAPELPATTLDTSCYGKMFYGCTSLTTAPELLATTLTTSCYYNMFSGCTNLKYIICLATDISANSCTTNWVTNVASSGTFIKDASMSSWTTGNNGIPSGWTVQDYIPYDQQYLTFEALQDTTFTHMRKALQYSLDNGSTWTTLAANTASPTVTAGNKILWKQTGLAPTTVSPNYGIGKFSATGNFKAYGNIMSLYYGDNFIGQTDLTGKNYAFYNLFSYCNKLVNAENLILPATTLSNYCYDLMFSNCTALTKTPKLPATILVQNCYSAMFRDCTSLTTAPELPATILISECYKAMFDGCSALTTAPELPATTLAYCCYQDMFSNCTALTTAPELPATTLADYCYNNMFSGCSSLNYIKCLATDISATDCTTNWLYNVSGYNLTGIFIKANSMSDWTTGVNGIPYRWTVQDAT